jgi:hypothetical protein
VARRVHVRPIAKLRNQREFAQIADGVGENGGGADSVGGTETLTSASSLKIFARQNAVISCELGLRS